MSEPTTSNITPISIETEMRNSFMDYAMSVIVARALPDARDGLKPVHQGVAQAEVLGHTDDGVVDRGIAVGVVLADHVADDAGGLLVGLVPVVGQLVHGEENPPVHGLQAVPDVRKRPPHDHAHGVIEVGAAHLLLKADRVGFFGERFHGREYQGGSLPTTQGER